MKKRIDLLLKYRNYAIVARILGLKRGTIREYFIKNDFPMAREVVRELTRGKKKCDYCRRHIRIVSHGKCDACYKYFRYVPVIGRRTRLI